MDEAAGHPRRTEGLDGMAADEAGMTVISTTVDRLIHEPVRLAIMANLFVVESANATYLLRVTESTWGNLGAHLARLERAGYVTVSKGFQGRRPETTIALTDRGRKALLDYREHLMMALAPMTSAAVPESGASAADRGRPGHRLGRA
jgi:DNA-binding MarR family transcriptional regulator